MSNAQNDLNLAVTAFNAKNFEQAYTLWTANLGEVVEESRSELHVNRGKAQQARNLLPEALACYAEALSLNPANIGAMRARTTVLLKQEDFAAALASAEAAISAAPADGAVAADAAFVHLRAGRGAAAVAGYEAARALGDATPATAKLYGSALSLRAGELEKGGDEPSAMALYDAAIAIEATESRVCNRGLIHMRMAQAAGEGKATDKHTARALADLHHAVRLNHAHPAAHAAMGTLLTNVGDYDAAIVALKSALKYTPRDVSVPYNLGFAQLKSGRVEEARASFKAALLVEPGMEAALRGLKEAEKQAAEVAKLTGGVAALKHHHSEGEGEAEGGGGTPAPAHFSMPAAAKAAPAAPPAPPAPPAAAAAEPSADDPAPYFQSGERSSADFDGFQGILAPLAALVKAPFPEGVNKGNREAYLSATEFKAALGMDKPAFYAQPKWKRDAAKKKALLF